MTLAGSRLAVLIVLNIAASAYANAGCADTLSFASDGSIDRWVICQRGVRQSFAVPGHGRLRLALLIDGRVLEVPVQWRRSQGRDGEVGFTAIHRQSSLVIVRAYERESAASLSHTISLRNTSPQPIHGIRLRLYPGRPLPYDRSSGGWIADFVYGYQRSHIVAADKWQPPSSGDESQLFALTARHRTFIIDASQPFVVRPGKGISMLDSVNSSEQWVLEYELDQLEPSETYRFQQKISAATAGTAANASVGYPGVSYAHLWAPLAFLCQLVERAFISLSAVVSSSGLTIILFAIAIRLLTLPVSLWSARRQQQFTIVNERIKPKIADVRAKYQGAEQSERILAIYRENRISPFSGLKGSVGLFVQIPLLLAVFNVTTVSSIFAGEAFLWIDDLSLPDTLALLPVSIPSLGSHLNALPIALGVFNLFSFGDWADRSLASICTRVIVTFLIVVIFYSFAAALVLYWLIVNAAQVGERVMFRSTTRIDSKSPAEAIR